MGKGILPPLKTTISVLRNLHLSPEVLKEEVFEKIRQQFSGGGKDDHIESKRDTPIRNCGLTLQDWSGNINNFWNKWRFMFNESRDEGVARLSSEMATLNRRLRIVEKENDRLVASLKDITIILGDINWKINDLSRAQYFKSW